MGTITNTLPTGASGTADTFTSVSGARGTSSTGSSAAKREVDEAMITYQPFQTPILTELLTGKFRKKPAGNQKFEWIQTTLLPRTDTISWTGTSTSEDNITVGDSSLYQVGTKFVVDTTGDVVIVDSIASSEIDVTKVGSGNMSVATSATIHFLGDAFEQGSSSATAKSVNKSFPYNYVEIFKKAVNETESQQATVEYGPDDWNEQKMNRMSEFKMDLEGTLLFGVRDADSTGITNGSYYQYYTGGVLNDSSANFIPAHYQYVGDAPDEAFFFDTFLKGAFSKGTGRKRLYAGADLIVAINNYSKVKQQTKVSETVYGVNIQSILCPFGKVEMVWHPMLEGLVYAKKGVLLDLGSDYLKYRYLAGNGKNRDLTFVEYPHFAEQEQRKGEWKGEIGWQVTGGEYHAILEPAT